MRVVQVQSIILILISVVYTILAHVSHKKDAWKAAGVGYDNNSSINSIANKELAEKALLRQDLAALFEKQEESTNFNLIRANNDTNDTEKEDGEKLAQDIRKMKLAIATNYKKKLIDDYADGTEGVNVNISINNAVGKYEELKDDVEAKEVALKAAKQVKPRNDKVIEAAQKALEKAKKTFEPEEQNTAVKNLDTALDALRPDGKQMQERSVILVIISVLVLLLDMNGLLFSGEVGDPLQVVVGAMLVVFGINVLVNFDKNNKINLGTIKVLKDLGDNAAKKTETQAAAVFGTLGGILCAVLGAQVLLKSVVKKMPSFKIKKPSFKSLKRKKKK